MNKIILKEELYVIDKLSQERYYAWIQNSCSNTIKQPDDSEQDSYTYTELGPAYLFTTWLYTNNTNLEKIVMAVDRSNCKSKKFNQYIIAPAKTLEEALKVYNELSYSKVK